MCSAMVPLLVPARELSSCRRGLCSGHPRTRLQSVSPFLPFPYVGALPSPYQAEERGLCPPAPGDHPAGFLQGTPAAAATCLGSTQAGPVDGEEGGAALPLRCSRCNSTGLLCPGGLAPFCSSCQKGAFPGASSRQQCICPCWPCLHFSVNSLPG